ncbi:hypothetical protein MKW94_026846 [Papaver nudicaule]|uniref:Uncharacterized protein n=1 Tax=Papaver nudicaule TaxID=74823 RepID=A0AA41VF24_PAPNU|nr:hypothetical protein [Papaver nudicaule]
MGGVGRTRASRGDLRRWVWAANPNTPVGKNSTLTFGRNGNLILADSNGRVVWQTKTANKGVTDIKLLSNGNLVLVDRTGRFVWQSFDHPTDTLLNGQGLAVLGSSKLVSGSYSMDVETRYPVLLFKNKKNPPMVYHSFTEFVDSYDKVKFFAVGKRFSLFYEGTGDAIVDREVILSQRKYNTTLSMLRLEKEGDLHVYTYNGKLKAWETSKYSYLVPSIYECSMPEKCGVFGLCKNRKCVSCPSSKGLMAWSKECKREKIPPCNATRSKAGFYKMESVSSSLRTENNGDYKKMSVDECKKKCSEDCKCTGVFYRSEEGTCAVTTMEIFTLTSDPIRFELGYIEPVVDTYIKYAK